MPDNRPGIYEEDGKWVYRISTLGSCFRVLWGLRSGLAPVDPPDWMKAKYEEGNRGEPVILDWLEKTYGGVVSHKQDTITIEVGSKAIIRGHPDGLFQQIVDRKQEIVIPYSKCVVEAKAFSVGYYEKWKKAYYADSINAEFPYYAAQISLYMEYYQLPCVVVVGVKNEDGDCVVFDTFTFDVPPRKISEIKLLIMKLELLIEEEKDMPDCDKSVYPCPFYYLHEDKDIVVSEDAWLAMTAKSYFEANEAEKKAREDKARAREYIAKTLDEMDIGGEEVVAHLPEDGSEWKIKDVIKKEFKVFDEDEARKDGVNVDKYKTKVRPGSRYPIVTPPKEYRATSTDD